MECKVVKHNGINVIDIDGKKFPPMSFKTFRACDRNIGDFYGAGIRLFCIVECAIDNSLGNPYSHFGDSWIDDEVYDFSGWDRFQRIIEYDRCDFEYPSFKTDSFMLIELTIFPGRTSEQKGRVIEGITGKLNSRLSVDPGDVFITINEPPLENWGIGGNQKG